MSDNIGARAACEALLAVDRLIPDRNHDADRVREALENNGIQPSIPGRKTCGNAIRDDKRRNRIAIMFGRLEDWRRIATRYDTCPKVSLSALALAVTVIS